MIRGFYAAAAGMNTMLARAQLITNNLTNVNTPGFKQDVLRLRSFQQTLNASIFAGGPVRPIGAFGMGIVNEGITTLHTQGQLQQTINPHDIALQGPGFFQIQTPDGIRYTRDGAFHRDANGTLITPEGYALLGANGPITVGIDDFNITREGNVIVQQQTIDPDGNLLVEDQVIDELALVAFERPDDLKKIGNSLFEIAGPNVPTPLPADDIVVLQGFLELSNVDAARAMADLMVAQRAYESNQRSLGLQDEILGRAVNDIGRL
ncbi:MAG: flagellar biosynthesis protein FlgF [Dehalococcoidia bacterium]|nr:flagellar biosynthesis protein FlgF [Dehalococcoidia bacterium]